MMLAAAGILTFLCCSFLAWSQAMRFFASWNDVCFNEGPGWSVGLMQLVQDGWWTSDLLLSSAAPFLPFLLFMRPTRGRTRQVAMLTAMIAVAFVLHVAGGPVKAGDCTAKPVPELGNILLGVMISLPLALGLAWLTRARGTIVRSEP
jgi:hypothetical protein